MTSLKKVRDWFNLKYYQYEINTSIYMLEPWEKKIFSIFSKLYFVYRQHNVDCLNFVKNSKIESI